LCRKCHSQPDDQFFKEHQKRSAAPRAWRKKARALLSLLGAALLALTLAGPVAAEESYWLDARETIANGKRWYLMKFGRLEIGAGEVERVWLSLASCPGGVDNILAHYVEPIPVDREKPWGYQAGWGYGVPYNGYPLATSVVVENPGDTPMTFVFKLQIRCDE
jgi:hypothetical protein